MIYRILFAVRNLPFADSFAQRSLICYDTAMTGQKEETDMRHVYVRCILALIWVAVAVVSGGSGNLTSAGFYLLIGGVLFYSAYSAWRKTRDEKGEQ